MRGTMRGIMNNLIDFVDLRETMLSLCKKILLRSTIVQVITCSDNSAQLDLIFENI